MPQLNESRSIKSQSLNIIGYVLNLDPLQWAGYSQYGHSLVLHLCNGRKSNVNIPMKSACMIFYLTEMIIFVRSVTISKIFLVEICSFDL